MKKRIDLVLVERGIVPSRERAQGLILNGQVLVNDVPVTKSGQIVACDSTIRLRGEDHPYVSRGGIKLAAALDQFCVDPSCKDALDIGASTGGFTQVLLMRGAQRVFAVDVGLNQLDWKIRSNPRVVTLEKMNVRYLKFESIGKQVDVIVVDVSFISLEKVIPCLLQFSRLETDWITLIKPQFEVGPSRVGKGGIVRSAEDHLAVVDRIQQFACALGLERLGLIESPIKGAKGNKEFLAHWKFKRVLEE